MSHTYILYTFSLNIPCSFCPAQPVSRHLVLCSTSSTKTFSSLFPPHPSFVSHPMVVSSSAAPVTAMHINLVTCALNRIPGHRAGNMNFSESFTASRGLVEFSPDGRYIGSCSQHRVVVRDAASLQILHLHTCLDPVQQLLWSPDSLLLLTAMFKRGIVQVSNYSTCVNGRERAYPTHVDR